MSHIRGVVLGALIFLLSASVCFGSSLDAFQKDVYKEGVEGPDVKLLQQALKIAGTFEDVELTEYYGLKTEDAVRAFQQEQGLDVDGITGDATLEKLDELGCLPELKEDLYKLGMEHADIKVIQAVLHSAGYFETTPFTNRFDEATKNAVVAFQEANQLDADGIVGQQTIAKWKALGWLLYDASTVASDSLSKPVTRGVSSRYGEYIGWSDARTLLPVGTYVTIQDFYTGKTFKMYVGYGTLHADVEPATKADTQTMLAIWGGDFTWVRRPVLVYYGDRVLAASLNCMPHAGREDKPALEYVSNRSSGFGSGKNYDLVKGNGASGVMCLHFKGSRIHATQKADAKHQANVKIAAGL